MNRGLRMAIGFAVGLILGGASVASFAAASDYGRSMRLRAPASSGARFTGAPIYDWADAPSGWGRMNDINKINIGSKSFDVTGGRLFSPGTLARGAVSFARFGGPAWLGFMLAGLVWDEVSRRWLISEVPDEVVGGMACREAAGIMSNGGYAPECDKPAAAGLAWFRAGTEGPWAVAFGGSCGHVMTASWRYTARGYNPGTCPALGEERVATDLELEDAIYVQLVARGMGSDLARRLIKAGYKPTPDGFDLDGPSSIPGDTVTTTTSGPAGQTSRTTNTSHNITYNTTNNTSTVTITNTTTTTVTSPDGTTTETTTETPSEGGETTPPEEPKPFCELNPTASACAELGETQDEDLDEESVNVSWSQEGGAAGACPAPIQISVLGTQHAIEWTPICQVASGIRPIVIGLAWLSAALWLFLMARARA